MSPVLAGEEIVGHVDPKADRERRRLIVLSRELRRGYKDVPAVKALAAFLRLCPSRGSCTWETALAL